MFGVSYGVAQNIEINKPIDEVISVVSDFNTWRSWSPWLSQEKECPTNISGTPASVGHSQSWSGERIGEGSITINSVDDNRIYYDLDFIKPWKAHSDVSFQFLEQGNKTKVIWDLKSELPFFMFFMKKMMVAFLSIDYDRGLSMLKDYIEQGMVHTDTTLNGVGNEPGFHYVGIRRKTTIAEMPDMMSNDLQAFSAKVSAGELDKNTGTIAFYHKFDIVAGICDYTTALTYERKPTKTANFESGEVPEHKGAKVTHKGEYKFLGNAWSSVMGFQRAKKLKFNKAVPWYERYLNNPQETESKDLVTEIILPVK